jgi:hypothetical protein
MYLFFVLFRVQPKIFETRVVTEMACRKRDVYGSQTRNLLFEVLNLLLLNMFAKKRDYMLRSFKIISKQRFSEKSGISKISERANDGMR